MCEIKKKVILLKYYFYTCLAYLGFDGDFFISSRLYRSGFEPLGFEDYLFRNLLPNYVLKTGVVGQAVKGVVLQFFIGSTPLFNFFQS